MSAAGKHTPGPWAAKSPHDLEVETGLSRREMGVHTGNSIICSEEGRWIALAQVAVHVEGRKSSEGGANARLIAAAPDLLEALKGGNFTYLGDQYVLCIDPDVAKLAIAKAEGGEA